MATSFKWVPQLEIHELAKTQDVESVCKLIENGISIDARDENDLTPLAHASKSRVADVSMVRFLVESGADVNALVDGERMQPLVLAACSGDQEKVQFLADAGANIDFVSSKGYAVLVHVMYKLFDDAQLVPMTQLLTRLGADVDCETNYEESPLSVASQFGRFDAVNVLLDAGADPSPLRWTTLMRAVALGTTDDLEQVLKVDESQIHKRDRWERTAWLLACVTGDIDKGKRILAAGADLDDRQKMGADALGICAARGHTKMLRWILDRGAEIDAVDDTGQTALMMAVQSGNTDCVRVLLESGANSKQSHRNKHSLMSMASSEEVMRLLIDAGHSITEINPIMKRRLLGLDGERVLRVSVSEYQYGCEPRYGKANPEVMNIPFWNEMVRTGIFAHRAKKQFRDVADISQPTWCHSRYGVSLNELPDGRLVQIGGEHEDYYDPDFCIYNDVLVHEKGGRFEIMGYPKNVFPPTDFHTATYFDGHIYIIGGLGYQGTRQFGMTPVYRLDCRSWKIESFASTGDNPGWIYKHVALMEEEGILMVSAGKVCVEVDGREKHEDNTDRFAFDLQIGVWTRITNQP
ncbi:MAG: ankyrin repeat domain-containing protein [Planctomycetota bacterium]